MSNWNYADVWEVVADTLPDSIALIHGEKQADLGETERRANGLARWLLDRGVGPQDKVALYLYNCSEYLEATFAAFKIGLVPVNTNYRYADDELAYLWTTPTRWPWSSTASSPNASTGSAGVPRGEPAGCGSTTGRDRARAGPPPTRTPWQPGRLPDRRALGAQRR